jgi:glutamine synthetase
MAESPELAELAELTRTKAIDTVLCVFPDLWGRMVGKRYVGRDFVDRAMSGQSFHAPLILFAADLDVQAIPGQDVANWHTGFSDFHVVPDYGTLRTIPWLEKTALVICDAVDANTGLAVPFAPRTVLKQQIERARAMDVVVKAATELEFYLFQNSFASAWETRYRQLVPIFRFPGDHHIFQTSLAEPLIRRIRNSMETAGVPVEASHGEWGSGQNEINLKFADALEMADRHLIFKNGVKEIAAFSDVAVTFMARWSSADASPPSSCHLHSSLWTLDGLKSLSWDDAGQYGMSSTFQHYLAGLLAASRDFAWLYSPFINSYRRYFHHSGAGTTYLWGRDNRTCGFRVVGARESLRVENRLPGADVNPYLVLAATIASGLHGIRNQTQLPDPCDGDAYADPVGQNVPDSLEESITALAASNLVREAFGDPVRDLLLHAARNELAIWEKNSAGGNGEPENSSVITEWELIRYFERA